MNIKKGVTTLLIFLFVFISLLVVATPAEATSRVRGYYKPSTGTYVQPYYRSSPNRSTFDNWSTRGNYNPYTGKSGTQSPFKSSSRWRY